MKETRFAIEIRTNYRAIVSEKVIYGRGWARDAAMVIASEFKAWRKLVCATQQLELLFHRLSSFKVSRFTKRPDHSLECRRRKMLIKHEKLFDSFNKLFPLIYRRMHLELQCGENLVKLSKKFLIITFVFHSI